MKRELKLHQKLQKGRAAQFDQPPSNHGAETPPPHRPRLQKAVSEALANCTQVQQRAGLACGSAYDPGHGATDWRSATASRVQQKVGADFVGLSKLP